VLDRNRRASLLLVAAAATSVVSLRCTTVDPGPNFSVAEQHFDEDYFYCHVEPELIFAKRCGGDPSQDPPNGCHYNSSAVSGMALIDHPPVDCGGGDHPVDKTQIGSGSAARGNYQAVSLDMSRDYLTANIYVRPTNTTAHPTRGGMTIYTTSDPVVDVIRTWAQK
jgi:hypothetical protein